MFVKEFAEGKAVEKGLSGPEEIKKKEGGDCRALFLPREASADDKTSIEIAEEIEKQ